MVEQSRRGSSEPSRTQRRLWQNPDAVLRERDEHGGLLFNPDTGEVRVVNPTGLLLWELCDGTHEVEDLVGALAEEFREVPADEIRHDVTAFTEDLLGSGLLGYEAAEDEWKR